MLRKLLNLLLVIFVNLIVIFLILLAGEMYLRMFRPQPLVPRYVTGSTCGIRVNYPGIDIWHTTPDYHVNVVTNSKGLRADNEYGYEKPARVKRMIALGDSFTLGMGTDNEDVYVNVIGARLREKGINTEVINFGVSGYSNAEELIILENEAIKYKPDIVILGFYANDIDDNLRTGLFKLENGELVRGAHEYLPQVKTRDLLYSIPVYRYLAGRSHLLYYFREKISMMLKNRMVKESESKYNAPDIDKYKLRLTAAILDRIYEVTRSCGAELYIIDITEEDLVPRVPLKYMKYADKVHYINSGDILAADHSGKLLYWERSLRHWTPYSHKIVGDRTAEDIINKKILIGD